MEILSLTFNHFGKADTYIINIELMLHYTKTHEQASPLIKKRDEDGQHYNWYDGVSLGKVESGACYVLVLCNFLH